MFKILNLKPEAFGLDVSDLSLKVVGFQKKGKFFNLASFGETQIKPGIIREGKVKKEDGLIKAFKKVISEIKGKKINTKYVIASLPEEKTFLQVIKMPPLPKEDLKSAVIYEAENYIPLPIENVYLDYQIISFPKTKKDHYQILIAAISKEIVDSYSSCLKRAGLKPLALEVESIAVARALIKDEASTPPVLIIDLGATQTSFIVFFDKALRFTSSIPVSCHKLTEAISQTINIDLEKAEKLKIKYGIEKKSPGESQEIFNALIPALTDLTEQIKKYLDYYQTHAANGNLPKNGKQIKKIILCGGGANLKGLGKFLSQELNLPVELGNPWINILPKPKPDKIKIKKPVFGISFEKSLSYTTAIGLALKGIKKN